MPNNLSQPLLTLLLDSLPDGLLVISEAREVMYLNQRFREMWRVPKHVTARDDRELITLVLNQLKDPDHFIEVVERAYQTERHFIDELEFIDGRVFSRRSASLNSDMHGRARIWIFTDITALKEADIDVLTDVYNRRCFENSYTDWVASASERPWSALVMVDIDHFKPYNDNYGHLAGDEALRKVSAVLKKQVKRHSDHVYRYGGEEFVLLLSGRDRASLLKHIENTRLKVLALGIPHEENPPYAMLTLSIGCIFFQQPHEPFALFHEVDKQLYKAKDQGRNCLMVSTLLP
ncbi:GGDEF domain-containing protein [Nitrincola alkalilacustris]|uniref:GGDEF domain-containing protein n=1 Tax=Nitrincola alkalilacustris TaxID=1571224 RepID=UPI00124C7CE2|nr:sensor domain-containing diguanylate cyclase [Nitrincola alkalilacustris]